MPSVSLPFPLELYGAAASRALDAAAIEGHGINGLQLMIRAGTAAFDLLRERWPWARRVLILCGGGNNGGDGFVLARLALEAGLEPRALLLGERARLRGDAALACEAWEAVGGSVETADIAGAVAASAVVVDALLGTGLDRPLQGAVRDAVEILNASDRPVLALDIPTGLHADTGAILGTAVRATTTLTFIGLKPGLFTGEGAACRGDLRFDDLGVPAEVYTGVPPSARRIDIDALQGLLLPRSRTAHKGHFGHVLVVGGEHGFAGAVRLAGEAAARTGAGLVSVATRAAHVPALVAARPELMVRAVEGAADLRPLLAGASVIAVGPGLGQEAWGSELLQTLLDEWTGPTLLDADALNLIAGRDVSRDDWVLTPHPGEAARLLGSDSSAVQADRLAAAAAIVERHGGCVVLKGAGSVVLCRGEEFPAICSDGNPGMASGGMGDVLSGVIAALMAQGHAPDRAARLGVCLHARAADVAAAADGQRGLLAGDLFAPLRRLANPA